MCSLFLAQGPQSYANWTPVLLSLHNAFVSQVMDEMFNFPNLVEAAFAGVCTAELELSRRSATNLPFLP